MSGPLWSAIPPLIWKDFDAESCSFGFQLTEGDVSRKLEYKRRLCLLLDQAAQQCDADGVQQIGRTQPVSHALKSILYVRLVSTRHQGDMGGMLAPRDQTQIMPLTLRKDNFTRLAMFMRCI